MSEMTRAATLTDLHDLLERAPRANLAFETLAGIAAIPVGFRYAQGKYWVGVRSDAPAAGSQAMLLIDDGWYYFELRGLRVRGTLRDTNVPAGLDPSLRWLRLEPLKINAWDYGSMRTRAIS